MLAFFVFAQNLKGGRAGLTQGGRAGLGRSGRLVLLYQSDFRLLKLPRPISAVLSSVSRAQFHLNEHFRFYRQKSGFSLLKKHAQKMQKFRLSVNLAYMACTVFAPFCNFFPVRQFIRARAAKKELHTPCRKDCTALLPKISGTPRRHRSFSCKMCSALPHM